MDFSLMNQAIIFCTTSIERVFRIIVEFLSQLGAIPFILSIFTIWTINRFILSPLIGSAGSDMARAIKNTSRNKKSDD